MLKQGNIDKLAGQLEQLAQNAAQGKLSGAGPAAVKDLMQAMDEALKCERRASSPDAQRN